MSSANSKRHTRLRREYLYKKSLQGQEKLRYEMKEQVRKAIAEGKALPGFGKNVTEMEQSLRKEIEAEDGHTSKKPLGIDDEYKYAGVNDPKICITTSRDPSSRLKQFAKEVKLIFPNSQRVNRGGYKAVDLIEACRNNGFTDIVLLHEHRGEPDD